MYVIAGIRIRSMVKFIHPQIYMQGESKNQYPNSSTDQFS